MKERTMIRTSTVVAAFAAAVCLLALPAVASATVFCVHDPACPAGGVAKNALGDAIQAADLDQARDTVRIGPGTFPAGAYGADKPIDIVGAGRGATTLTGGNGPSNGLIYVMDGTSSVSDLTVRLTANGQKGIRLMHGADARRVAVTGAHNLTAVDGIYTEEPDSDLQSIVIDLGPDLTGAGINDSGGRIEDADVTAGVGILAGGSGTIARRVTVRGQLPLEVFGGTLNIANALVRPYPDPGINYFVGVEVENGNDGAGALLHAADITIAGNGFGAGIAVHSNTSASTGTATATLDGAVFRGVNSDLMRDGESATETADLQVAHSSFDAIKVDDTPGNGTLSQGSGNITGGADPRFVNPAAGDFRLRYDSPLLDKGPPVEPLSGDDPDLAGLDRVVDSDGNGSAVRDIGAYEYQRRAPVVSVTAAPASALVGAPFTFGSQVSDPDGDPISSSSWTFDDGAGASGASVAHAFASAGSHTATASATDATGLTGSATGTVTALAQPGPGSDTIAPALRLSGKRAQRLGRSVYVVAGCPSEDAVATARGRLRLRGVTGAATMTLRRASTPVALGKSAKLRLRLTRAERRAVGRALRSGRRVRAAITVTARDAAGNATVRRRAVRIRL